MSTPVITIFVRHSADCKYKGDEFCKRCRCRKHLRWSQNGRQHRRKSGTRSWEEAEKIKRELEDQLAGRPSERNAESSARTVQDGIDIFLQEKRVGGISANVLGKYTRELERLRQYCERSGVYTVQGLTRELLTGFCDTWESAYPSSTTRAKVRERLRSFLRYCYEAQWIPRIPSLPKIQIDEPPTLPLTTAEFEKLLKTVPESFPDSKKAAKVRALVQLMRWSGLAIRDTVTLRRDEIIHDTAKKLYRIVTARQKTGTHVSVPIPPKVAKEVLAVLNGNPVYVFWNTGGGKEESAVTNWQHDLRKLFADAGIKSAGNMLSHRLRDTFAVDLLQNGVPLEEVSKLLGHESIKTTERHYARWVKGRQDRLDALVTGVWAKKHSQRSRSFIKSRA